MSLKPASFSKTATRYASLDAFRGIAIVLMFIYHFCYDLDYFGFIEENFSYDPFWLTFRQIIVSLFLFMVGVSLYLASYKSLNQSRFAKRLVLILVYAAITTLTSWVMYPDYYIFFGILHFIAFASVFGLLFRYLGTVNLVLGLSIIIITIAFEHPFFDQSLYQWIGLMTHLPATVDYVPLFPWFGVVLIGMYFGQKVARLPRESYMLSWQPGNLLTKNLVLGGQYSLHIYMLHQPVFMGILYIVDLLIN